MKAIPVIDLFAGPGGLGEGFSAFRSQDGQGFRIGLSIEKDIWAHKTLELRAFYRQFAGNVPSEYYDYVAGRLSREKLFERYSGEANRAKAEAWRAQLGPGRKEDEEGVDPREVDRRIAAATERDSKWVLIGGPPCQAYSIIGRSRVLGADRKNQTN